MAEQTTVETVRLYGWQGSVPSWQIWRGDFEEEFYGKRRGWVAEAMLYKLLELGFSSYSKEQEAQAKEMVLYLLNLLEHARAYEATWGIRAKLIGFLSDKFFGNESDERYRMSVWLLRDPEVYEAMWFFLSQKENFPVKPGYTGFGHPKQYEKMKVYVGMAYSKSLEWDKGNYQGDAALRESIARSKHHVLQALIHTDQLHRVFKLTDTSREMLRALKEYALSSSISVASLGREPRTVEEVVAFNSSYSHSREAALYAMVLPQIANMRSALAREHREQANRLASQ